MNRRHFAIKTLFLASFYPRSSMVKSVFDCSLSGVETDFLDAVCLPNWRQMVNSSDLRSTLIDCLEPSRLPPILCDKEAYLMIIE